MQNCAIKHGICFSLSVNLLACLVELAECLRNYLEAAIRVFKKDIVTVYHSLLFLPDGEWNH